MGHGQTVQIQTRRRSTRSLISIFPVCLQNILSRVISNNFHAHHSCVEKQKSCLDPVFPTIYDFGSLQFSDTLMSGGYFRLFLQTKVTKMCPKYILALHQNCPSQYQKQINRTCRRHQQCKNSKFLPFMRIRLWPILGLSVQYIRLFRSAQDSTSWPSG